MADTDATYNLGARSSKESTGGLARICRSLLWVSRLRRIWAKSWGDLAKRRDHHAPAKRGSAQRHETMLQDLRIRLHYLAGRREDRLVFDLADCR